MGTALRIPLSVGLVAFGVPCRIVLGGHCTQVQATRACCYIQVLNYDLESPTAVSYSLLLTVPGTRFCRLLYQGQDSRVDPCPRSSFLVPLFLVLRLLWNAHIHNWPGFPKVIRVLENRIPSQIYVVHKHSIKVQRVCQKSALVPNVVRGAIGSS